MTAIIALAAQACGSSTEKPSSAAGGSGGASFGGASGSAGELARGGSGGRPIVLEIPAAGCGGGKLFADQGVVNDNASPRVFYSWTTDEQVAELRAGGPLFSRSESPDKGPGLAMQVLAALGERGSEPMNTLAAALAGTVFAKMRFAWPNPWATLMGWPGESYGNQLLQVTLRPEAWVAFLSTAGLYVRDAKNQRIDIAVAAAHPELIGAIYFQSESAETQVSCGTFSQSSVVYREFVLGNLQMVESYALATPEIKARLEADITTLTAFSAELACYHLPPRQAEWSEAAVCVMDGNAGDVYLGESSMFNYDRALGMPSELYWPSAENLAALVAALKVSLPSGEPLVVKPGG